MVYDSELQIDSGVLRECLESIRCFVCEEFAEQRKEYYRQWVLPVSERIKNGTCIRGLRFQRKTVEGHLFFVCSENETDFREGDFLRLHAGDPLNPLAECFLVGDGDDFIVVDPLGSGFQLDDVSLFLDTSFYDLESLVLEGIDELGSTIRGRERIWPRLHYGSDASHTKCCLRGLRIWTE